MRGGGFIAAVAALALVGCGNTPDSQFAGSLREEAVAQVRALFDEAPGPPAPPSRAEIEAVGAPVVWIGSAAAPSGGGFVGLVENTGRVTYLNAQRQSVTLHGGQVTAARGIGVDLVGYRSDAARDPSVFMRPASAWPDRTQRIYRFNDGLGGQILRAAVCLPRIVGPTEITVFERAHAVVEIEEACRTPRHAFVNRYWTDPVSGFIWKSVQWVGPVFGSITVEIVVPSAAVPAVE